MFSTHQGFKKNPNSSYKKDLDHLFSNTNSYSKNKKIEIDSDEEKENSYSSSLSNSKSKSSILSDKSYNSKNSSLSADKELIEQECKSEISSSENEDYIIKNKFMEIENKKNKTPQKFENFKFESNKKDQNSIVKYDDSKYEFKNPYFNESSNLKNVIKEINGELDLIEAALEKKFKFYKNDYKNN